MSSTAAAWLQFALLFAALAVCCVPLGNYIARIYTREGKDLTGPRGLSCSEPKGK